MLFENSTTNDLVRVDEDACNRLSDLIAKWSIPVDREDSRLPDFTTPLIGNFLLLLVAICHQTSPRGREPLEGVVQNKKRRGWDYLFARLEEHARRDNLILTPEFWSTLTSSALRELFVDAKFGDRLINPELRAALLNDLGSQMLSNNWQFADQIYECCQGRVATGDPNLTQLLSTFRAYKDPVRKKTVFFLSLMRNYGIWRYKDDASLGAPVDYHEVRGHLRIGTVRVLDAELLQKLRHASEVSALEDVAIRSAVFNAIMLISERSGIENPSQLHYLFWNLFRSICNRQDPQCYALDDRCDLPSRYMLMVDSAELTGCPFASVCASAGDSNPICEHVFETDFY